MRREEASSMLGICLSPIISPASVRAIEDAKHRAVWMEVIRARGCQPRAGSATDTAAGPAAR
jgi:hypothetical protein